MLSGGNIQVQNIDNIEHKPNSLLYNLDNCIYSAKSHYRYCFENGSWSKEATSFRGQWGLTHDENGRLYSNDNSNFLIGDQFLPNTVIANQFQHQPEGQGRDLVKDRSLFPLHATAVNRGYTEGALDSSGRVKATTFAMMKYWWWFLLKMGYLPCVLMRLSVK